MGFVFAFAKRGKEENATEVLNSLTTNNNTELPIPPNEFWLVDSVSILD